MKPEDIKVGHFYVRAQGGFVREILSETGDGNVFWRDFDVDDGHPITTGPQLCSKRYLAHWAGREATAEEAARLQRSEADAVQQEWGLERVQRVLQNVPDEMLLEELRRRLGRGTDRVEG